MQYDSNSLSLITILPSEITSGVIDASMTPSNHRTFDDDYLAMMIFESRLLFIDLNVSDVDELFALMMESSNNNNFIPFWSDFKEKEES